jgi:ABC-type lipoprotein release transport system permease subunit
VPIFVKIAWRNVWRNTRRTVITLGAISVGLTMLIFFKGYTDGFHQQTVENSIKLHTGHIQIHRLGYQEEQLVELAMSRPEEALAAVRSQAGIKAYTQRVTAQGLIASSDTSRGILIVGVDPVGEPRLTTLKSKVVAGEYLSAAEGHQILIGEKLARSLKVSLGDKLVLLTQAADGSMGADAYRVCGLFATGSQDLDKGMCFIPIKQAQELLVLGDRISEIAIIVENADEVDRIRLELSAKLDTKRYEVLSWKEISAWLVQIIELDDASLYVIELIVFVIVALGILNTMLMSILERVREFGLMMAMGTRPWQVVGMVMLEALLLGVVSVVVGSLMGSAVTQYFCVYGMDLSRWAEGFSMFPYLDPVVYARLELANVVMSSAVVLLITLAASVYPAIKAARLEPAQAMHYV